MNIISIASAKTSEDDTKANEKRMLLDWLTKKLVEAQEGRLTEMIACSVVDEQFIMSRINSSKMDGVAMASMLQSDMIESMRVAGR